MKTLTKVNIAVVLVVVTVLSTVAISKVDTSKFSNRVNQEVIRVSSW